MTNSRRKGAKGELEVARLCRAALPEETPVGLPTYAKWNRSGYAASTY